MVQGINRQLRYVFLAFLVYLLPHSLRGQLLALPPAPVVSERGLALILDFEVGDSTGAYYNRFLIHPEWPGASSGVTIGIGYDLGYNSKSVILQDWNRHPDSQRLSSVAGITGSKAKAALPSVRDISTPYPLATDVFQNVTLGRFWALCQRTWPGFDDLRPNAQAALLSLTFNRGSGMAGDSRREMRNIRDLTASKKYREIADQIRKMERLWRGTPDGPGLIRRREAEANLMLTP